MILHNHTSQFLLPSSPQHNPYYMVTFLPKIVKWTEILGLIVSVAGILFKILHLPGADELLTIGLMTLSSTYFISGFIVVPIPDDGKPKGFADLLIVILRKVMFIGLAVCLVGFLFALLHLAGANEMLMIGIGTLAMSILMSMVLVLGKRERMALLEAPLIRGIVVLVFFTVSYLMNYAR
jgi:hypothetical protein